MKTFALNPDRPKFCLAGSLLLSPGGIPQDTMLNTPFNLNLFTSFQLQLQI